MTLDIIVDIYPSLPVVTHHARHHDRLAASAAEVLAPIV